MRGEETCWRELALFTIRAISKIAFLFLYPYCFCFKIMLACSDLYAMHIMYRYRYSACNTYFFFMSNG